MLAHKWQEKVPMLVESTHSLTASNSSVVTAATCGKSWHCAAAAAAAAGVPGGSSLAFAADRVRGRVLVAVVGVFGVGVFGVFASVDALTASTEEVVTNRLVEEEEAAALEVMLLKRGVAALRAEDRVVGVRASAAAAAAAVLLRRGVAVLAVAVAVALVARGTFTASSAIFGVTGEAPPLPPEEEGDRLEAAAAAAATVLLTFFLAEAELPRPHFLPLTTLLLLLLQVVALLLAPVAQSLLAAAAAARGVVVLLRLKRGVAALRVDLGVRVLVGTSIDAAAAATGAVRGGESGDVTIGEDDDNDVITVVLATATRPGGTDTMGEARAANDDRRRCDRGPPPGCCWAWP